MDSSDEDEVSPDDDSETINELTVLEQSTDRQGDVSLRFRLSSEESNDCRVLFNATGVIQTPGPAWFYRDERPSGEVSTRMGLSQRGLENYARVNIDGLVDETVNNPINPYFPFRWEKREIENQGDFGTPYELEGERDWVNITLAGRELMPPDETSSPDANETFGDQSFILKIKCSGPFALDHVEGSRIAHFFDEASLEGGVGIHADVRSAPSGAGAAGRFEATIDHPSGLLFLRSGGDLFATRAGGGVIQVEHPDGEERWIPPPPGNTIVNGVLGFDDDHREYQSGAGEYTIEATFASMEATAMLEGALLAFEPLNDPAEVLVD